MIIRKINFVAPEFNFQEGTFFMEIVIIMMAVLAVVNIALRVNLWRKRGLWHNVPDLLQVGAYTVLCLGLAKAFWLDNGAFNVFNLAILLLALLLQISAIGFFLRAWVIASQGYKKSLRSLR